MQSDPLSFSARAHLSEWMDQPCRFEEFRDCLQDLARLNRLTLAHRPTLRWLELVASRTEGTLHIVDVGCGGGDLLRAVERWAAKQARAVLLTGIDLNPFAARAARDFTPASSAIRWVTGDAFSYQPAQPIHCVVSSLFTHHLPDDAIRQFLHWMEEVAASGWFINDLYRSRLSYVALKALLKIGRWHPFVRHDGPVSIRRSFRLDDWKRYVAQAGLPGAAIHIEGVGPARLCVSRVKA